MTRTRISLLTVATALGAALPAFAQAPAPAPAPMYAPAQAPMMMAPAQEAAVMPAAPMMAPKASDDMTGSVGFGVGVGAGTSLVIPDTSTVAMKYWMSDAMALIPRLAVNMTKVKDTDTGWKLAPALLVDFTLLKGASTRFSAGGGLGLTLAGKMAPATTSDTYISFQIPVQLGVEHFFTRWFSMGLGTGFDLLSYTKDGTKAWTMNIEASNIRYMGSLFFYTD